MDPNHARIIQQNFVTISKHLLVDEEFLSYFLESKVLTDNNMEEILAEKTNLKKSNKFAMIIRRRGPNAFPTLLKACVHTCQEHIAKKLDAEETSRLIQERDLEEKGLCSIKTPTQETSPPFNPSSSTNPATNYPRVNNDESSFMTVIVPPTNLKDERMLRLFNDSQNVYGIKHQPRGRAIIINNERFMINAETKKKLSDREGASFDLINLDQLFQNLHFTTKIHSNLTSDEIKQVIKEESGKTKENESSDAFILCILSHGAAGFVAGIDGKMVSIESEICRTFDGKHCPSLIGKPKIFIIQACQGRESTAGVPLPDADDESTEYLTQVVNKLNIGDTQDAAPAFLQDKIHEKADMLIAYSTVGGYKSWRRPDLGSWFVRAIVDIFAERAHSEHIVDLLTKVRSKVIAQQTSYQAGDLYVQVTKTDSTLTKDFYFFPGYKPK